MIRTELLSLEQKQIWNSYLTKLASESYDVYFTPEYYELHQNNGDGIANCFVFESDGKMALYPFLLNSVNALGYKLSGNWYDIQGAYGYNGVISNSFEPSFKDEFYNAFANFCENNNIIAEFTRFHPLLKNHIFSVSFMDVIEDRQTVFLNLMSSYEYIWEKQYSSTHRNMIRKAFKSRFKTTLTREPSSEQIKRFTSIYQEAMSAKGAEEFYFFSYQYFKDIFDLLKDKVFLLEVEDEFGNIMNVSIIFITRDYASYHLSARVKNADNSSNNLLLDQAVRYLKEKGVKKFYFGGGATLATSDPLFKFKTNSSKDRATFYIGKKIYNRDVYKEVIRQWEEKSPASAQKFNNQILKYRNIERD